MDGIRTRTLAPVAAIALLGMTAAYVQLTPTPGYTSSAPAQASAQGSRADAPARAAATPPAAPTQPREQVVTARRGSITDTITLSGRIGAADEVPLSFPSPQRVGAVNVGPGDTVTEGQVLVEADQSDLAKSLGAARERLAAATSKLRQAQDAAGKQQRRTEIRQTLATNRAQQGVLDAEAGLRQAEAAYEKIKGGASTAERRAAETAVSSARAALVRAEADLNKLREGTDDLELRQAQQSVMVAQVAYQKAQDDYQKLQNGPDQTALRAAERDFLTAQNGLMRAQADLQKLAQPDPVALTAAQREVDRARSALRVAELAATSPGIRSSSSSSSSAAIDAASNRAMQAERQNAVTTARMAYQTAQERLQAIQAGPPPYELIIAQRNVSTAQSAVDSARDRLAEARRGPDAFTLTQAQMAVETARLAYETAAARESKLLQGVGGDQMNAALTARDSAESAVRTAEAQQAELLSRPSANDLATAEESLRKARDILAQARVEANLPPDDPAEQSTDTLAVLQQVVDQEQLAVNSLESDIVNARVIAPFDGRVVAANVRPKEGVDAGKAVVILARTDARPLVLADVPATDGARLTVGQQATIRYGGASSGEVDAPIGEITGLPGGLVHLSLEPAWAGAPPTLGSPASILILADQRADVVVVPEAALRGAGKTRTVDVLDGDERRQIQVTVGLVAGGDAEILSGISEGTRVVLAQ
ncbi:MAG: HlyD family efflux transporter periplasmic adaptor subunit [Chloroflexota bacterium]